MLTLLVFLLILSILVVIHEFGHFFVARRMGIKVEEFGFGIPPRLWGKKIGETVYSINALPFGGFVKVLGEDSTEASDLADPANFMNKTPWQRLAVLLAGVTMNVLLAISVFYIFFGLNNFKSSSLPLLYDYQFKYGHVIRNDTVIFGFEKDSPAQKAGVQLGESIKDINGTPVNSVAQVRAAIKDLAGKPVKVTLLDTRLTKATTRELNIVPAANTKGEGFLGVSLASSVILDYGRSPLSKITAGFQHSLNVLGYSMSTFSQLVNTSFVQKSVEPVSAGVSGPVGIFTVVEAILKYPPEDALFSLMDLIAILSLSLAFINVLPLPALDGGRAAFVLFEGVTKKKVSPAFEARVHQWGMVVLLTLTFVITAKDIFNLL